MGMKKVIWRRSVFPLLMICFLHYPALAAVDVIETYKDSQLREKTNVFPDGGKVYVAVSNSISQSGAKTLAVTNQADPPESVTVEVSDDGEHYDLTANDGIFTGMFMVTTKLTLSPAQAESLDQPLGICYRIVKNLHLDDQATARLEADLDGDGVIQPKLISLAKLLNITVRALRDTSAAITWNTGDSAYGRVEYGVTTAYGQTAARETAIKDLRMYHEIVLSGLAPNTTYHFCVSSLDTYGSSQSSEDHAFTTLSTSALEDAIKAARSQGDLPTTYYVKVDGSNSETGLSRENAWQSPAYAVQQAEAGDTIYLIAGTWSDEHLDFSYSGLEAAPITLTTCDNGMSVLDGLDKTGFGIRLRGKSHIRISRVHIKNYYNAMYFQDELSDIKLSDFIVENTQRTGITFSSGSGPISRITFSQFEIYETGIDGGCTALSYGGGSNFKDIEIYDFKIHDTYGSGIYWRYVDRLHINDGSISNIQGSDGVSFSLRTCSSIMENLKVDNCQWHGVAIHDWTVGNNPCFNNTIRDCEITNADHNHVDLHSGAYNTMVERNTLHEQLSTCTGIYFHNRGAGLIARDNHIYHVSRGFSGGGYSEYPLSDVVIQNNTIHDPYTSCFDLAADRMVIKGNRLYNDPGGSYTMHAKRSYILMEDNDIEEKTYRIDSGSHNTIRNPRDKKFTIRSARGSHITFEYTDNTVYKQELSSYSGPYTLSGQFWTPEKSYTTMSSTAGENGIVLSITPYPMTIRPVAGSAQGEVSIYDASVAQGETAVEFTIAADERVDFVLKELKSNSYYNIFKDDQLFASRATGSGQEIKFFNYLSAQRKFTVFETDALVTGRIRGQVANRQGLPIEGAGISNGEHDVFADNNGCYALESRPIGEYELTASAPGYLSSRKIIILTEQGITVDFTLAKAPDQEKSVVYPNPYISGQSAPGLIYFDALEENSCIRIYTLDGNLVVTLENKGAVRKEWNISGVAGGVYLYYIDSPGSKKRGKISIIK